MQKDFSAEVASDAKKVPRRIAFIKARTAARVKESDEEMAMTFPSLVVKEIIAFEIMVIVLTLVSLFVDAPLEWIANAEHTPNPAKAPWYFLGLQELLHYFPPVVGGVILPMLAVVVTVGSLLSFILLLFEVYVMLVPTLVIIGCMLMPYISRKETGSIGWLGSRSLSGGRLTRFLPFAVF